MEEKKISKKLLLGVGVATIAVTVIVVIILAIRETPEQKIARLLDLGNQYLEDLDYEHAIASFDEVLSIEPRNEKAIEGEVNIYLAWSEALIADGDYDRAAEVLQEGYGKFRDERIDSFLSRATAYTQISPYGDALYVMAKNIVQGGLYDFSDTLILSDEFQTIIQTLSEPLFFEEEDGLYLGIYPGGYIYYGEMDGGQRSGHGYWYSGTNERLEVVNATWSNDMPNGSAFIESFINEEKLIKEEGHTYALHIVETVNLRDGIYEGNSNIIWDMDNGETHDWNVSYQGGVLFPINGRDAGYCKNCGAILFANDAVHEIRGI